MELRLVGGPHDGKKGVLLSLDAWPLRIWVSGCQGCAWEVEHTHHMRPANGPGRSEESAYSFDSEDDKGALYVFAPVLDHDIEREREAVHA